jgi:hypothetical protein
MNCIVSITVKHIKSATLSNQELDLFEFFRFNTTNSLVCIPSAVNQNSGLVLNLFWLILSLRR